MLGYPVSRHHILATLTEKDLVPSPKRFNFLVIQLAHEHAEHLIALPAGGLSNY